jgi:pimeloyl-ACP methyl ester carboxylesterase
MPGFGRSDPAPLAWKLEDFARNVIEIMDRLGLERVHLAGIHTGAVLASEIAAAYPDRIARLVLSGCAIYLRNETWKQKTAAFRKSIEARTPMPFPFIPPYTIEQNGSHLTKVWRMQVIENPHSDPDFLQKGFIAHLLHWDKRGGSAVLAQMEYDRLPRLPLIKAPTLCLSGKEDVIGPPLFEPPETASLLIPGARHQWLEGGLSLPYEKPDLWGGAILDFLNVR